VTPIVRRWSTSPDMWLRRSSILCQLGAKDAVDLELLTEAIEANASEREFFIRKAIGWALRQHAWRDPAHERATKEALQRALSQKKQDNCMTGHWDMDRITGGFRPGFVWVFGADTSWGKCLGRDVRVLRADGATCAAHEVRDGDLLMGPDSEPRTVRATTAGRPFAWSSTAEAERPPTPRSWTGKRRR